jgi:hypothetical protein
MGPPRPAVVYRRAPLEPMPPSRRFLDRDLSRVGVRAVRRLIVVLGLAVALLQGCSSGTGSSPTGPSSQTSAQPAGSDAGGGRMGSESGGNQMM